MVQQQQQQQLEFDPPPEEWRWQKGGSEWQIEAAAKHFASYRLRWAVVDVAFYLHVIAGWHHKPNTQAKDEKN